MKTYSALYIDPSGTLKAGEFPEEPKWHKYPFSPDESDYEIRAEQQNEYQQAFRAAKDSAAEVEDQKKAGQILGYWLIVQKVEYIYPGIYRLPDGWGLKIETFGVCCSPMPEYGIRHHSDCDKCHGYSEKKKAVLVPPKSEQRPVKTANQFLYDNGIDIGTLNDEFNTSLLKAMEEYADQFKHLPDSGKMVESQTFTLEDMKEAYIAGSEAMDYDEWMEFDEWIKTRKP